MSLANAKAKLGGSGTGAAAKQVVKEEAAAEKVYQATRKDLPAVITEWAATLVPKNAPEQKNKGPLAWVREVEVPKLLAALAKEGYK